MEVDALCLVPYSPLLQVEEDAVAKWTPVVGRPITTLSLTYPLRCSLEIQTLTTADQVLASR